MTFQVVDDHGTPLDAHYDVDGHSIIFYSRGGSKTKAARNADYGTGLRLLLSRIIAAGIQIEDAWVDSSVVQSLPIDQRRIVQQGHVPDNADALFKELSRRMASVGRASEKPGGNPTKRIRIHVTQADASVLAEVLGGKPVDHDMRSLERLPADELNLVRADHVYHAIEKLAANPQDHPFGDSIDYDLVLDNGTRLPPKAVFGLAATEALGFEVRPKHFSGGEHSFAFNALRRFGYSIVPKQGRGQREPSGEARIQSDVPQPPEDREWAEGSQKRAIHLKKERASGVARAKKDAFRAKHGRLFCERCKLDPREHYGSEIGEACIEVHHTVPIAEMTDGHVTKLSDLQCLCASCHRVAHREMREASKEIR